MADKTAKILLRLCFVRFVVPRVRQNILIEPRNGFLPFSLAIIIEMSSIQPILISFFFASVLLGPWWISIAAGIWIASISERSVPLIVGGMLMDMLFGAPIPALFGFNFLYTTIFLLIVLSALYFRRRILE